MHIICQPVKLQKNAVKASRLQIPNKRDILCQTEPIGIDLDKAKPHFFTHLDNLWQIIPNGGLSPGKLDIATAPCKVLDLIVPRLNLFQIGITMLRSGDIEIIVSASEIGRSVWIAIGKADWAVEIASMGHLQKGGAGALSMSRADTAIKRATVFDLCGMFDRASRCFGPNPIGDGRCPFPDEGLRLAMLRAGFYQINALPFLYPLGINLPQTVRAKALGGG